MRQAIIGSVPVRFLERDVLAVYRALVAEDGEIAKDNWIRHKLETGRVFSPAELAIAEWVDARPKLASIVETGCGYGGLAILLAMTGCQNVTAAEGNGKRAAGAFETVRRLRGTYPKLDGCRVLHGWFPDCAPEEAFGLFAMSNVVGGWFNARPGEAAAKWRDLIRAPEAIIDGRTAYAVRESEADRAALVEALGQAGFSAAPVPGTTLLHLRRA